MQLGIVDSVLILLFIAVIITTIFRRLQIPAIVGYILVGIVVGPHAFAFISNSKIVADIAEFGIIFLMFTIGLEFSLPRLLLMKKLVFGYGGSQVLLSILITTLMGIAFKMTLPESVIIGFVVAMSSTAIVSKQLTEQLELNSAHGSAAIGILLLQDLAVIPIFILIPSLVNISGHALAINMSFALLKGIAAIIIILSLGRWVLRPLFYMIANTRSLELFTLSALLVTVGAAWITHQMGLSTALGAFLAGMMLGETEFRHQIESEIRPFRDVLLGFFFISIGMQFNTSIVIEAWPWMLLLLMTLIVFKTLLIFLLGLGFENKVVAGRTSLILAHGGEFSFAILALALSYQLLPADYGQVILGAILLSMVLAPIFIRFNKQMIGLLFPGDVKSLASETTLAIKQAAKELKDHVILCGYGRVGQNIARLLEKADIPYIALDVDPTLIQQAKLGGEPVFYADASQYDLLKVAGIQQAQAIVITFLEQHISLKVIAQVRQYHHLLPIVARGKDETVVDSLYQQGATEVIPDALEASLMLGSHILILMKTPKDKISQWLQEARHNRYDLLRMVYVGDEPVLADEFESIRKGLHVITLTNSSYATNKLLKELPVDKYQTRISAIRRHGTRYIDPDPNQRLLSGDIVVIYGPLAHFEDVENLFVNGVG